MMKNISLNLLVLRSVNPQSLATWYSNFFECEVVEEKHGNGPLHYSISFNDFILEIYPAIDKVGISKITFGFIVEQSDFQTIKDNFKTIKILDEYSYILSDPEGNRIIFQKLIP